VNIFVDSGGANPAYLQLPSGATADYPALPAGDSYVIQVQGVLGFTSLVAGTVHRAADCHAQAAGVNVK
jgi:hypothetical protein